MAYINVDRPPDAAWVELEDGWADLEATGRALEGAGVHVSLPAEDGKVAVRVRAPGIPLRRIKLRWRGRPAAGARFLGDHWERGYGDLEWRGMVPERVMPWYFLMREDDATHGYGVMTGGAALCFWQADPEGINLWLDVRCGGAGVELGDRELEAAVIVARQGRGESPFEAACALCSLMCPEPLLPARAVYGGNNWYYAYGDSSHERVLGDAELMAAVAPEGGNRPFMVVDGGWQAGRGTAGYHWDRGNEDFPDMPRLASEMDAAGVRPGIWVRPLVVPPSTPDEMTLPPREYPLYGPEGKVLDPTVPEALAEVRKIFGRFTDWGYRLIKHDFTTLDLLAKWGYGMGPQVTGDGWSFADRSRTTAEAIRGLYRTMREAAGDAVLIGCNTVGHLAAGLFELQRTGDDTSGKDWERTRKMGINSLAFRMPQHGRFFVADADCVGLTAQVPWRLNRMWLDLLARSGTALFVSADPGAVGPEQRAALEEAFAAAASGPEPGRPLDWTETTCPASWLLQGEEKHYDWYPAKGADPFGTPHSTI